MSRKFRAVLFSHSSSNTKELDFSVFHLALFSFLVLAVVGSITAFGVIVVSEYLYSYRLDLLRQEKSEISSNLSEVTTTVQDLQKRLNQLYTKDDELRTMVDLDPVDQSLREVGTGGGIEVASNMSEFFFTEQELLSDIIPDLEKLKLQVEMQELSYNAIQKGVEDKKVWLRYYPGGRPIDGGKLTSYFGPRTDPFDPSRTEYHKGLDIGGLPVGTPVTATADGRVIFVERRQNNSKQGFGLYVRIEHDAGQYKWRTLYGHLSKIESHLRTGMVVKRGDKIGELGNTGRSEAPHLHYGIQFFDTKRNAYTDIDPRIAHINPDAYK